MKLADRKPEHFLWEVTDRVAVLRLNRPERKNPLTFESYAELRDLFRDLVYATDVDVVVLASNGGNFCSGGDVHDIIGPLIGLPMKDLLAFTRMTGDLVKAMISCGKPIIAAVDGVAVGAGAILGDGRRFAAGDAGGEMRVLVHAGRSCGLRYGRLCDAAADHRAGSGGGIAVYRPGDDGGRGRALGVLERFARRLMRWKPRRWFWRGAWLRGRRFAHGVTKTQLLQEWDMGLLAAIEAEAQAQAICMQTKDFERAYRAFVAKEKPVFAGD